MVSFHSPHFDESLSNKRKREDNNKFKTSQEISERSLRAKGGMNSLLPLSTPLPLEWQRCLDIKSGQVYFYNTRTQEKTSWDPRLSSPEPPKTTTTLDLELNLLCGSSDHQKQHHHDVDVADNFTNSNKNKQNMGFLSLSRSPSWLTFDGGEQQAAEMVTAVCKKCHMLVMVCKSSPTCPNCKFVNLLPADQKFQSKANPLMLII